MARGEIRVFRRPYVAHSLSAKKRVRQNIKARAANRARKELLKDQTKSYLAALSSNDLTKAAEELNKTVKRLDKIAAKHTIHKNTAARHAPGPDSKRAVGLDMIGKPAERPVRGKSQPMDDSATGSRRRV